MAEKTLLSVLYSLRSGEKIQVHERSHIVLYLIEVFMSRVIAYEPLVRSQHLLFLVCRLSEVADPPKSYTDGIGTVHPTL